MAIKLLYRLNKHIVQFQLASASTTGTQSSTCTLSSVKQRYGKYQDETLPHTSWSPYPRTFPDSLMYKKDWMKEKEKESTMLYSSEEPLKHHETISGQTQTLYAALRQWSQETSNQSSVHELCQTGTPEYQAVSPNLEQPCTVKLYARNLKHTHTPRFPSESPTKESLMVTLNHPDPLSYLHRITTQVWSNLCLKDSYKPNTALNAISAIQNPMTSLFERWTHHPFIDTFHQHVIRLWHTLWAYRYLETSPQDCNKPLAHSVYHALLKPWQPDPMALYTQVTHYRLEHADNSASMMSETPHIPLNQSLLPILYQHA